MTFTAWGIDGRANTLIRGSSPPCFCDGTRHPHADELIWTIEAKSWDDANKKYHELHGWEPFRPMLVDNEKPYPEDEMEALA
jgi:hypothetical protein